MVRRFSLRLLVTSKSFDVIIALNYDHKIGFLDFIQSDYKDKTRAIGSIDDQSKVPCYIAFDCDPPSETYCRLDFDEKFLSVWPAISLRRTRPLKVITKIKNGSIRYIGFNESFKGSMVSNDYLYCF